MHRQLLVARAKLQGFLVLDYKPRFHEAIDSLAGWVRAKKLAHKEHILEGVDAAPDAINMLYEGRNKGKLLVKVD